MGEVQTGLGRDQPLGDAVRRTTDLADVDGGCKCLADDSTVLLGVVVGASDFAGEEVGLAGVAGEPTARTLGGRAWPSMESRNAIAESLRMTSS